MDRNKYLKELIKIKREWMKNLEDAHKERMQFLASEIDELQFKLKLLEGKDNPSV